MGNCEIINTGNVLVRVMELEKDGSTEWHFHSEVADYFVCLQGSVQVETKDPDEKVLLNPGGQWEVKPMKVHRVINSKGEKAKYLLVQGVGTYDFCKTE